MKNNARFRVDERADVTSERRTGCSRGHPIDRIIPVGHLNFNELHFSGLRNRDPFYEGI